MKSLLAVVVVSLMLSGCVFSVNPIRPAYEAKVVKRMLGTWTNTTGRILAERVIITKSSRGKGLMTFARLMANGKKGKEQEFFISHHKKRWFVNLTQTKKKDGMDGYLLAEVSFPARNKMVVYMFDSTWVAKQVEESKIKGRVEPSKDKKDKEAPMVFLNDASKNLATFLLTAPREKLFGQTDTFVME